MKKKWLWIVIIIFAVAAMVFGTMLWFVNKKSPCFRGFSYFRKLAMRYKIWYTLQSVVKKRQRNSKD